MFVTTCAGNSRVILTSSFCFCFLLEESYIIIVSPSCLQPGKLSNHACLADCENVSISLLASNISAFKIFLHWVAYLKIFQSLAEFIHSVQKSQIALYWLPNKVDHHRLSCSLGTQQIGSFFISQPPFPGFSNPVLSFTPFLLSEITQALSLLTKVLTFWGPLKVCILYGASFPSPEILLLILCLILHFSPFFLTFCHRNILNSVGVDSISYLSLYNQETLSLNKYWLSTYSVSGADPSSRDAPLNKTNKDRCSPGADFLVRLKASPVPLL